MTHISRNASAQDLTIASSANVSNAFIFAGVVGGHIMMPAAWTAASIGFQVCDTIDGTFQPLYDEDGSLVQISSPAVDQAYNLPAKLFGAMYVKLWSQDGAAGDTNQAAARTITIVLKS